MLVEESGGVGGQESFVGVTWSPGLETIFLLGCSGSSRLVTFLWSWRGLHVKLKSIALGPGSVLDVRRCMRLPSSPKPEPGKGQVVLSMAGCRGGLCWPVEGPSLEGAGGWPWQQSLAPAWCWKTPLAPYHLSIICLGLAHWETACRSHSWQQDFPWISIRGMAAPCLLHCRTLRFWVHQIARDG